ncbi:MAG: hypothetical protein DHS20C19_18800 [Acidimicrobiales bacterium]|nr:MAG: hypothetical protein DHS20C19_18800 [Acidimicrobiales bacterium]
MDLERGGETVRSGAAEPGLAHQGTEAPWLALDGTEDGKGLVDHADTAYRVFHGSEHTSHYMR